MSETVLAKQYSGSGQNRLLPDSGDCFADCFATLRWTLYRGPKKAQNREKTVWESKKTSFPLAPEKVSSSQKIPTFLYRALRGN